MVLIDRWQRVADGERGNLRAAGVEEGIGADQERPCSELPHGIERHAEIVIGARIERMNLQTECVRCRLHIPPQRLGVRIGRIDQQRNDRRDGYQIMQQLQSFRPQLQVEPCHAREIATRLVEALDEAEIDGVAAGREYNGNRRRCFFGRQRRRSARGDDNCNLASRQIGRQRRQPVLSALCPAVFDGDVPPLDIAGFGEPLQERSHPVVTRRSAVE